MRSGGLFLKREIYVPNQWAGWRGRTSCPVVVKKSRAKGDVAHFPLTELGNLGQFGQRRNWKRKKSILDSTSRLGVITSEVTRVAVKRYGSTICCSGRQ